MTTKPPENGFLDVDFQDRLIWLLVHDHKSLTRCAIWLTSEDFKPEKGVRLARSRWLVAGRALEFHRKHHEPIGKLLVSDVIDYAKETGMGDGHKGEAFRYIEDLNRLKVSNPDPIVARVVDYKSHHVKAATLREMADLLDAGQLTDDQWFEHTRKATRSDHAFEAVNFNEGLDNRMARRLANLRKNRVPMTLIDPLDVIVSTVGPRQLGLALAPYKRGKSLFLEWLAAAFSRQRLNVLLFTLEDPLDTVEDRLDSIISGVPIKKLIESPRTLKRKFERYRQMVRSGIEIYDGTQQEMTVPRLESVIENSRNRGFFADVILVDYDDKLSPTRSYREKRFEIDEVYKSYLELLARRNLIGWMAAQSKRGTRDRKILSGDEVAEDIGKMRKVTCGISLGKGDWTDDSIYLWVAAHRNDVMEKGCEIVPDRKRAMIYDEDATRKAAAANA